MASEVLLLSEAELKELPSHELADAALVGVLGDSTGDTGFVTLVKYRWGHAGGIITREEWDRLVIEEQNVLPDSTKAAMQICFDSTREVAIPIVWPEGLSEPDAKGLRS